MPIKNYDNLLIGQFIRAIENPDSIGFKNGRWYAPDKKGFDSNNRGFGVDIKYNKKASHLTKNRKGQWLTEQEEEATKLFSQIERTINKEETALIVGIEDMKEIKEAYPSYFLDTRNFLEFLTKYEEQCKVLLDRN